MTKIAFAALALLLIAPSAHAQDDEKKKLADAIETAKKAIAAEKYQDAESALAEVSKLVFDSPEGILLRAKANFALEEYGKSGTFADRAAELDPKSFEAYFVLGKSHYQQAEVEKTNQLASGAKITNFYEQSVTALDKALKLKADDPDALEWKGYACFSLEKFPESVAALEKLVAVKPDVADYYRVLARSHIAAQNMGKAIEVTKKGLTAKTMPAGVGNDLIMQVFDGLAKASKLGDAFDLAKGWAGAHPEDPAAFLWMGYIRRLEGSDDEAITHFTKCFEVSGKQNAGAALELGMALGRKGEPTKAAEWLGTALKLQPEWTNPIENPLTQLNDVAFKNYIGKREFGKGIELLEKHGFPAAEKDWGTLNNLGLFYRDWADSMRGSKSEARAKNEKSLEYYTKAVKLLEADTKVDPAQKAQVTNDLGVIHDYQLGNLEKGVEFYRKAVAIDPNCGDALENLGLAMNKLGKYEEAVAMFERVIKLQPDRAKSLRGLADAKKGLNK